MADAHATPASGMSGDGAIAMIGKAASAIGVVVASAYGCGFLIVNAFLGEYGVFEPDAFKPAYLTIGAIFLLASAAVWVSTLRRVPDLNASRDVLLELNRVSGKGGAFWRFCAGFFPVLDLALTFSLAVVGSELVLSPTADVTLKIAFYLYASGVALFFVSQFSRARKFITPVTLLYLASLQIVVCVVTLIYAGPVGRGMATIFYNLLMAVVLLDIMTRGHGHDHAFNLYLVGVYRAGSGRRD